MYVFIIITEETEKQVVLLHTAWEEIFLKIQKQTDVIYVDKNPCTNCHCLLLFQIEASEF